MKTDALSRRLRFAAPSPQVRRLELQEADYLLFEAISRHGPLPSNYLHEFIKSVRRNEPHLKRRLTEFYNGDENGPYLTRPPQQFAGFDARYQHVVYDLAPRARRVLAERGVQPAIPRKDPFLHQLMQACVGASLELCIPEAAGLRYISRSAILAHPQCPEATKTASNPLSFPVGDTKLIPDDLFGIEYLGQGFRFFAVEIDRNTESIERRNLEANTIAKKVRAYETVIRDRLHKDWLGISNLSVLIVTTNATHGGNILEHIEKSSAFPERFAVSTVAEFAANWRVPKALLSHLVTEPWATSNGKRDITVP